jgi:threonine dehydrogenase-like Zn-dependent dehydrogenase
VNQNVLSEALAKAVCALRRCDFRYGKYIMITGCDAVSLLAGAVARSAGAAAVVVCAESEEQVAMIRDLGFEAYRYGDDLKEMVRRITDVRGFNLALETLGDSRGYQAIMAVVKQGAKVGMLTAPLEPYLLPITVAIRSQIHFIAVKDSDERCRQIAEKLLRDKKIDPVVSALFR